MRKLILSAGLILVWLTPVFAPPSPSTFFAPETGSIRVAIFPAKKDASSLSDGAIIVTGKDRRQFTATAGQDGYYVVRLLLPGPYSVTARVPGYAEKSKTAKVKKYELTEVSITLVRR